MGAIITLGAIVVIPALMIFGDQGIRKWFAVVFGGWFAMFAVLALFVGGFRVAAFMLVVAALFAGPWWVVETWGPTFTRWRNWFNNRSPFWSRSKRSRGSSSSGS